MDTARLAQLDHAHVWHPFTPMRQWREQDPLIIARGEGPYLFDTDGNRYIDGVSSLWCNVHGHRVPQIDQAIRDQLDRVAHTTLLGLASPPSIELAAELVKRAPRSPGPVRSNAPLTKVFYSDAGATAVEVALKMAVGYWHHTGHPERNRFVALRGAYHGDTTGSMSVGFSELFHTPFRSMTFPVHWIGSPDAVHGQWSSDDYRVEPGTWPSEHMYRLQHSASDCIDELEALLRDNREIAAVILEPVMQGAAGMMCQPWEFKSYVRQLCDEFGVLLIADEVATGFGRTGSMFACDAEPGPITPDILCLAKGITGGYLPLAATLATDAIYEAFCGELHERRTLYHGHTYTGNALACAAALASLRLFDENHLLDHARRSAALIAERLNALRDESRFPHVIDVRQRGLMVGIELGKSRAGHSGGGGAAEPFDFSKRTGAALCAAMRPKGLILRPLGDVIVLMPILATPHDVLHRALDILIDTLATHRP